MEPQPLLDGSGRPVKPSSVPMSQGYEAIPTQFHDGLGRMTTGSLFMGSAPWPGFQMAPPSDSKQGTEAGGLAQQQQSKGSAGAPTRPHAPRDARALPHALLSRQRERRVSAARAGRDGGSAGSV